MKTVIFIVVAFACSLLTGCSVRLRGQPTEAERWRAPDEVTNFNQLYAGNCAGCHGAGGRLGAARSLNDPLYQSFISDDELRHAISQGRPGTSMPAFSQQSGGTLTDQQITSLVAGMRAQWARPDDLKTLEMPPYSVGEASNGSSAAIDTSINSSGSSAVARGATAYQTYCASCHGTNGAGGPAGSIVDPDFLNLVSDQGLRTTVVVGRADLGKPDWRSNLPGHPMSLQEINDVVMWLSERRQAANLTTTQNLKTSVGPN
jgi:cytochrome c oxidase cbb3-type subunit 3